MQNVIDGDGISLLVPFKIDGDYVVPDVGSVGYTLRGNDGAPISGQTNQSVGTTTSTTSVPIHIPGSANVLVDEVEIRTLQVKWQKAGKSYTWFESYRVVEFANYSVNGKDVRALLGVSESELPDDDVDLFAAYMDVRAALGETVLDDALASGTRSAMKANEAIACQAAIGVIPSLQLRALQRERVDTHEQQRSGRIDFKQLRRDLSAQQAAAIAVITGTDEEIPILFTFGTPTDAITGA